MDDAVYMRSFKEEFADIKQFCESSEVKREVEHTYRLLSQRPLVLYGAGAVGVSVAGVLRHYGLDVTCFCDKNKSGIQRETQLPIISPLTLINDYTNANVVICSVNFTVAIISFICGIM